MRLLPFPLILASLAGAGFGVMHYPLDPLPLCVALAGYAALLWVKPDSWLFVIPAVLPIADLAPWSGWLFFEELDLFVLTTVAIGYWKLPQRDPESVLPFSARIPLALLTLSFAIGVWRGLVPLQPLDANAFGSYLSHYNSLRMLKPFLWALLLLPLLGRIRPGDMERLFVPGLATGLALVAFAALWERMAFTGIMDFSSDYRITSTFPEMHVGGAALDAFLAMTLPFSLFLILKGKGFLRGAALAISILGIYAALVTFSRGLYLAFAVSVVSGAAVAGLRSFRISIAILLSAAALVLVYVFSAAGYRGLFVAVSMFFAAFFVGGNRLSFKLGTAVLSTLFLPLSFILFEAFAKGAYLSFGLAISVFFVGLLLHSFAGGAVGKTGTMVAAAGFLSMAASGLMVDWHWGGAAALAGGAVAMLLALSISIANAVMPLWRWNWSAARFLSVFLMFASLVIPVVGNYYIEERFSEVGEDFRTRADHWAEVAKMMDTDWETRAFGMGLGKFPETYFWRNGEPPGICRIEAEREGNFLRLSGSLSGYQGEYLRYGQRVDILPHRTYKLELDMRSTFSGEVLVSGICEKLLLYGNKCTQVELSAEPDGKWRHYTALFDSNSIDSEPWYERPTAQFYLGNAGRRGFLDLKNASLSDGNIDLIRNGDFRQGGDRWFFSSDHLHLPWHEKNLVLHLYFDHGILGVAAFCLLFALALGRLAARAWRGDFLAAALLSSLSGLFVVGFFDSVLDFPRIALLAYLLLFSALLRNLR